MKGKRIIICGGRDFLDWDYALSCLDKIHRETPIEFVFHGNARGADAMASVWAQRNRLKGVREIQCPAEWSKHGKAAGPKRNQAMLGNHIDFVVAFPGGKGTADMVRRARSAGIEVLEIPPVGVTNET